MKVFISGIAGFLGSHLAHHFIELGHEVCGIDNLLSGESSDLPAAAAFLHTDCADVGKYESMMAGVDLVYHCAAAPYEGMSIYSPAFVFRHTTQSTASLITAAVNHDVRRFVYCSSIARYGRQIAPFTEDMAAKPVDPYGIAKACGEDLVVRICDTYGLQWSIAVPHNIYGPRQRFHDPYRNVVAIMINRLLLGIEPIIYGSGNQLDPSLISPTSSSP